MRSSSPSSFTTVLAIATLATAFEGCQRAIAPTGPASGIPVATNGPTTATVPGPGSGVPTGSPIEVVWTTPPIVREGASAPATIEARLKEAPKAKVVVPVSVASPAAGQASVDVRELVFTPESWQEPRKVNVLGQADAMQDGDAVVRIVLDPARSDDPRYAGVDAEDLSVTVVDADAAGLALTAKPAVVNEKDGTATLALVLGSRPTSPLRIALATNRPGDTRVEPAEVVVAPEAWNEPIQARFVTLDTPDKEGDRTVSVSARVVTTEDRTYAALPAARCEVLVRDDDAPGVRLEAATSAVVFEDAGRPALTFTLSLASRPTAPVELAPELDAEDVVVEPASVVVAEEAWDKPVTFYVRGKQDAVAMPQRTRTVTARAKSRDTLYEGRRSAVLAFRRIDDDVAALVVTKDGELRTREGFRYKPAVVNVSLATPPRGTVTVPLTVSAPTEGTVSPATLTFTASNWNAPQNVTITPVNDRALDGDVKYTLRVGPAESVEDDAYAGIGPESIDVVNEDDERPRLELREVEGLTVTETGDEARFVLAATSAPPAPMVVPLVSSRPGEVVVEPSEVVLDGTNYTTGVPVTVRGARDARPDGDTMTMISVGPSTSRNPLLEGVTAPNVAVITLDESRHLLRREVLLDSTDALFEHASANGRYVLLRTRACPGAEAVTFPVMCLVDLATGQKKLVGTGANGNPVELQGGRVSDDGAWVAFQSSKRGVLGGRWDDLENRPHVFLKNVATGALRGVTVAIDGLPSTATRTLLAGIHPTGRWVLFESDGNDLVADDTNGVQDVFVFDRDAKESPVQRVSLTQSGREIAGPSSSYSSYELASPFLGNEVLFATREAGVTPDGVAGEKAYYARRLGGGATRLVTRENIPGKGLLLQIFASADASTLVFPVMATASGAEDGLFTERRGRLTLASDPLRSRGNIDKASVSKTGAYVAYVSSDAPNRDYVMVRSPESGDWARTPTGPSLGVPIAVADDGSSVTVVYGRYGRGSLVRVERLSR